jgi:16S rRNA (cytidine1402-2'-O)-methyltransferase
VEQCQPGSKLCVASNLTGKDEYIKTQTIAQWKKSTLDLNKQPTIFLLGC